MSISVKGDMPIKHHPVDGGYFHQNNTCNSSSELPYHKTPIMDAYFHGPPATVVCLPLPQFLPPVPSVSRGTQAKGRLLGVALAGGRSCSSSPSPRRSPIAWRCCRITSS